MERRVEEARATQERESAKKVVEEALVLEREKIALLTKEVEELKVLFPQSELIEYPFHMFLKK